MYFFMNPYECNILRTFLSFGVIDIKILGFFFRPYTFRVKGYVIYELVKLKLKLSWNKF